MDPKLGAVEMDVTQTEDGLLELGALELAFVGGGIGETVLA